MCASQRRQDFDSNWEKLAKIDFAQTWDGGSRHLEGPAGGRAPAILTRWQD
jgi:hypothetical protein